MSAASTTDIPPVDAIYEKPTSALGHAMQIAQDIFRNPLLDKATDFALNASRVGQALGIVNPKFESALDVAQALQQRAKGEIDTGAVLDRTVKAYANVAIMDNLTKPHVDKNGNIKPGMNPFFATILAGIGSEAAGLVAAIPAHIAGGVADLALNKLGITNAPDSGGATYAMSQGARDAGQAVKTS